MQLPLELIAAVSFGGYVSVGKIIPVLLVLLLWARVLTWIDKDAEAAFLPREWVNLSMLGAMILGVLLIFIPLYAIAFPALLVVFLGSVGAYIGVRHSKVGLDDLKRDFRNWRSGHKKGDEVEAPAGAVVFIGKNNSPTPAPTAASPDRQAYDAIQQILSDPMLKNAERIEMTPAERASQVRFVVDGFAYSALSVDRMAGGAAVTYLKQFAGLDINEKRKPQTGVARVRVDDKPHELLVTTQGSMAGEFLKVVVDPKKRQQIPLDDMGFSPEQLQVINDTVADNKGIVLVCAPKGQGLTSMLYGVLQRHDAFLQHIQTIERMPDQDLEGITQNKLPANPTPDQEHKLVEWVCSQQADVLMVNLVEDGITAKELIRFAHSDEASKRVYVGMRAGNTFEAIAAWRKLVGDDRVALRDLRLVISGRIMRRLCMACKEAYSPDPETLRKLNINQEAAGTLFQERRTPIRNEKGEPIGCDFCKELRFNGRFGVYEVLRVDDDIRQALLTGGSANQLKTVFRKQHGRLLQEMALAAVERGDTSIKEMVRVLKGDTAPATASSTAAAARSAGAARPTGVQPPTA